MKKSTRSKLAPPWTNPASQLMICGAVLFLVTGFAASVYWSNLNYAVKDFYSLSTGALLALAPNTRAADFIDLLDGVYSAFLLMPITAVLMAFYNYQGFSRGTKALYLMKRLPDRRALPLCCLGIPVLALAVTALVMVLLTLGCLAGYYHVTPEQCLQPHQWDKFWTGLPHLLLPHL